jgi:hypothetical protein
VAAALSPGRAPAAVVGAAPAAAARGSGAVEAAVEALQCVGAVVVAAPAGKVAVVGAGILIATFKVGVGRSWVGDTMAVFGTGLVDGVFGAGNGIPTA